MPTRSGVRENLAHLRQLETWLRSYRPQELFGSDGRPVADALACVPDGTKRLGSRPYADGLLVRDLPVAPLDEFAVPVDKPGTTLHEPTRVLGDLLARVIEDTGGCRDFRVVGPDETASDRSQAVFDVSGKAWQAEHLPVDEHLGISKAPIVSRDVIGDSASCVFDPALTQANGALAKVFGWYDNEWGRTNRLLDLTSLVAGDRRVATARRSGGSGPVGGHGVGRPARGDGPGQPMGSASVPPDDRGKGSHGGDLR